MDRLYNGCETLEVTQPLPDEKASLLSHCRIGRPEAFQVHAVGDDVGGRLKFQPVDNL